MRAKERLVSEVCEDCGGRADMMVLDKGKVICFSCLAEKYPGRVAMLIWYLVDYKHVKGAAVKTSV